MSRSNDLQPLTPEEGIELYREDRRRELADATLRSHGYRLERFREWCDREGITNLNTLTGRYIPRFKIHRQSEVSDVTLKSNMDTLRVWLRFISSIDGVIDGLDESVNSPSLATPGNRGTDIVPRDLAKFFNLKQGDEFEWEAGRASNKMAITIHHGDE